MKVCDQGRHYFSIHEERLARSWEKDGSCGKSSQHQSCLQGIIPVEQSEKFGIALYLGPSVEMAWTIQHRQGYQAIWLSAETAQPYLSCRFWTQHEVARPGNLALMSNSIIWTQTSWKFETYCVPQWKSSFQHCRPKQCWIGLVLSCFVCLLMLAWHEQHLWSLSPLKMIDLWSWVWSCERLEQMRSGSRPLLTVSLLWDWIEQDYGMWQCTGQAHLKSMLHHSLLQASWTRQLSWTEFWKYENGILELPQRQADKALHRQRSLIWVRDD